MTHIFLKRFEGNRVTMVKSDKLRTKIDVLTSPRDIAIFVGIKPYQVGLQIAIPKKLRSFYLRHIVWSRPGMFISDQYDLARSRYKAWKYGEVA